MGGCRRCCTPRHDRAGRIGAFPVRHLRRPRWARAALEEREVEARWASSGSRLIRSRRHEVLVTARGACFPQRVLITACDVRACSPQRQRKTYHSWHLGRTRDYWFPLGAKCGRCVQAVRCGAGAAVLRVKLGSRSETQKSGSFRTASRMHCPYVLRGCEDELETPRDFYFSNLSYQKGTSSDEPLTLR